MTHPPAPSVEISLDSTPRFRVGVVARIARMPVATLRIWERRYGLTSAEAAASGHRLYSAEDVRRISLLKQLTDAGHAIGTVAALDIEQLQRVAATHVGTMAQATQAPLPVQEPSPWRVAVVGALLAHRLQQPSFARRLPQAFRVTGPFDTVAQAVDAQAGQRVDALVVHAAGLHEGSLAELQAAAVRLGVRRPTVLYGFASEPVRHAFAAAGVALLREPQTDAALAGFLRALLDEAPPQWPTGPAVALLQPASAAVIVAGPVPPRRYDDAMLARLAGRSTTVSCECPRHVVDLLMQLSHFEAYSAECERLFPGDAGLHAYLRQTSAAARHLFEGALERLVIRGEQPPA